MVSVTVPGLTAALRDRGYQVRGPAGIGGNGPTWAADAPDGRRAVVSVLDLDLTVAARRAAMERIEKLRTLRHPHLATLLDVVAVDSHRTALVTEAVDGPTVGAVLAVRPRWSPGEVVTLVVPLAEALAALHGAGLVHGDVAPENVVLAPGGRPVLIDLAGVVLPGAGTPGFVAPGKRGRAADDVFALARLGLAALGTGTDETRSARTHSLAEAAVREALEAGCSPSPDARPTPGDLAATCFAATEVVPIDIPDAAVLTRLALTRFASGGPQVHTERDPRVARRRRIMAGTGAVVATAVLVGVLANAQPTTGPQEGQVAVGGLAAGEAGVPSGVVEAGEPDVARDTAASATIAEAAVELTVRRAEVIAGRDVDRLEEIALPDSAAFEADRALIAALEERGEVFDIRAEGVQALWLETRDGRELVAVTSQVRVVGERDVVPPRTVVLALAETPHGWRVAEVLEQVDVEPISGEAGPFAG